MKIMLRVVLTLLAATPCLAQDAVRMDQVVQSYAANKQFMGAVLVARGGDVLFNKGYGAANLEWDIPNASSTRFRLGSITKQFTAAAILLLEERGKLHIEDPVKKYLPNAPAAWDKVTIFNLLTHTAGIPSFTSFPEYASWERFPTPVETTVARFRDKPLDFEPGDKWSYSNSGYLLLGYLIERISGTTYEAFVRDNIFVPLDMKDSGYDSNALVMPRRAAGYSPGPSGPVNAGFVDMTIPHAAGALYSTTEDLLRWERGLFDGKLLSPASLKKMTTPFKSDYAFGLFVDTTNGRTVIHHNGGIQGFNTALSYYPEDKLTVAVLANLNGQAPEQIAVKLAAVAHGEAVQAPSERKAIAVDPKIYDGYVGSYQLAPSVFLTVTRDGTRLLAQLTGQGALEIFPETARNYFYKVVDAQITFDTDDKGRATRLVLHQNGRDVPASRVEGPVPAAKEHKEVAVDPKIFDRYVGRYQLAPTFILTITREGDQLYAQATNQPRFQLFAEGDKEYFLKVVDAQISFEADAQGKATALVLHQNGANQRAARMD